MTTQTLKAKRQGYVGAARWAFVAACWLYAAGVVLQVFCIGMVFLAGQGQYLEVHRAVGHGVGTFAILALLGGLFSKLPRKLLMGAFGLVLLHGLQYAFIGAGGSFVRAFHAVNAVLLFWLAASLAQQARRVLRQG